VKNTAKQAVTIADTGAGTGGWSSALAQRFRPWTPGQDHRLVAAPSAWPPSTGS